MTRANGSVHDVECVPSTPCLRAVHTAINLAYHHTTPSNASKRKASESDSDNESEDDSSQTDINPYMPLANKYEILTSDGMAHQTPKNTKFQAPLIAGLRWQQSHPIFWLKSYGTFQIT